MGAYPLRTRVRISEEATVVYALYTHLEVGKAPTLLPLPARCPGLSASLRHRFTFAPIPILFLSVGYHPRGQLECNPA